MAKRGRGRPRAKVNIRELRRLARVGASTDTIAYCLDIGVNTLLRNFGTIIRQEREKGNGKLYSAMYEKAVNGNVPMSIWLSKNRLGYRDRTDADVAQTIRWIDDTTPLPARRADGPAATDARGTGEDS